MLTSVQSTDLSFFTRCRPRLSVSRQLMLYPIRSGEFLEFKRQWNWKAIGGRFCSRTFRVVRRNAKAGISYGSHLAFSFPMYCVILGSPRCKWELRSSWILRCIDWQLFTNVSKQPIGPIFKGQAVRELFLDCLYPEERTGWLFRNVGK